MLKKNLWLIILIALFASAVLIFLFGDREQKDEAEENNVVEEIWTPWGFRVDSIKIDTFKVKRNESLSDILVPRGISPLQIDQLAKKSKNVFDLRRIKLGNNYYVLKREESSFPHFFIYVENPIDYVVFELNDSLNVYRGSKPVEVWSKQFPASSNHHCGMHLPAREYRHFSHRAIGYFCLDHRFLWNSKRRSLQSCLRRAFC